MSSPKASKCQLKIIDALQAGGWLWTKGKDGSAYLSMRATDGTVQSQPVHRRTFDALCASGMIKRAKTGTKWQLV